MAYNPGSCKELDMTERLTHTHTHTHNDPAIPLLDIHPEKTILGKDTCTPVFTAALFTIAKTWKQPRCPLTDEWTKKTWIKYTMEYYLAIEKNKIGEAGAGALRTRLLLCMPAGMSEAEEACLWRVSQRSGAWRPSRGARAAD